MASRKRKHENFQGYERGRPQSKSQLLGGTSQWLISSHVSARPARVRPALSARFLGWRSCRVARSKWTYAGPLANVSLPVHGRGNFSADQIRGGPDRIDRKMRVTCRRRGLAVT